MYGLVNQAIEELITSNFGEDKWETIRAKAGVEDEVFISNDGYPDKITYDLVSAASEVLGLTADEVLIAFGKHWVLETAVKSYGPMMKSGGSTLKEFLVNLPNFHTRVAMIYSELQPPKFRCTEVSDASLKLHYYTERPGLTSFVSGIIHGLAEMFETVCEVTILEQKSEGADHDVFDVSWKV